MTDLISDTLEARIELLRTLDKHRKESGRLRDYGIEYLEKWIGQKRRTGGDPQNIGRLFPGDASLLHIIAAETIYRYSKRLPHELEAFFDNIIFQFETKVSNSDTELLKDAFPDLTILSEPIPDICKLFLELQKRELSVLFAAELFNCILSSRKYAYSKTGLICYYWIMREIYTADALDWRIGGARAAPKGGYLPLLLRHALM
jgi:hypothetical protein